VDNDFWGELLDGIGNVVSVSAILQLKAEVDVEFESTLSGTIESTPSAIHFEAARFPSPTDGMFGGNSVSTAQKQSPDKR
jgi:hypothetical protein